MPFYHSLGKIPPKRHTQFRQPDGSLYKEELVSSLGFSGIYSNLYHIHPPTRIQQVGDRTPFGSPIAEPLELKQTHLNTSRVKQTGKDFLEGRQELLKNQDVCMSLCVLPAGKMDYIYKNAQADEILFLHDGNATLDSQFGRLEVRKGDYVVIPRTTMYRLEWSEPLRILIIESYSPIETVSRYRNQLGQLLEHAPYCERDIRPPTEPLVDEEKGSHRVRIKKWDHLHDYFYEHSPFDVVGWDGFLYPYALSIYDFEPITGRVHQPPPVHQTFQANQFVICSFVPRLFDYHPLAIPTPYNHSNIDSDEVLYYVEGNFMSRKGIDRGSFTLHPGGLPHGPHPGTVEKSIGAKETKEYAVMLDTFRPLLPTQAAATYLDKNYPMSWTE
ncbi:MAG: homogentisate 1,2-dioxygenase [Cytophagales bacterium]|nr:homogentisate 1,2-dioxygenase [Cytophagales bacterium]